MFVLIRTLVELGSSLTELLSLHKLIISQQRSLITLSVVVCMGQADATVNARNGPEQNLAAAQKAALHCFICFLDFRGQVVSGLFTALT